MCIQYYLLKIIKPKNAENLDLLFLDLPGYAATCVRGTSLFSGDNAFSRHVARDRSTFHLAKVCKDIWVQLQEGLAWIHLRTPPPPPEHLVVLQTLQCFSEAHAVFGHQVGPDQCGPHHQLPTDKAAADQARSICHRGGSNWCRGRQSEEPIFSPRSLLLCRQ